MATTGHDKEGRKCPFNFRLDGHFKAELSQLFLKQLSMLSVGDRQQKAVFVGFTRPVESLLSPSRHTRATVRIT